ncbi:multicopper oxidase family protein [Aquibacillus sediminis]|uniref:multicopper oxidase family protein n=1 Tax=Aquibacillus sediminis TaxID=2574734 RepID=UPI0011099CEA|nr:multicopper oxidase [Aquibacillus sediminis]
MTPNLAKFVDRLPILPTANPLKKAKNASFYEMRMEEFKRKFHRDLPPTTVWGYNRQVPGPTIDVKKGETAHVKWINHLPPRHILPVDTSILEKGLPEVRTVTHLHGGHTPTESDGYPEAWFTRNFGQVGPAFKQKVYNYPNNQRAAMLWYHDHAMGLTRLNNYAGLAGAYIIRDQHERSLNLPSGDYEIPLVIQDRSFNQDGSLSYPTQPDDAATNLPNPSVVPAFLGDTIVVNGKVWPYVEVEPRKYRFRILNASNTRGYTLYLDSNQSIFQIGSDGGLLKKTSKMKQVTIEPSERFDVIIDFSKWNRKNITLKNDLGANASEDDQTDDIMQFAVTKPLTSKDNSRIPRDLSSIPSLHKQPIKAHRQLTLQGSNDQYDRPLLILNNKRWHEPVTEKPQRGTTEIWSFVNTTNFTHPMHIHLVQFQVLDRQPFDLDHFNQTGEFIYTGSPKAPKANERGWKDTVAAPGGQVTRVIANFGPYTGDYVWHCHILEHEDYDMMRPFKVIDPNEKYHDS